MSSTSERVNILEWINRNGRRKEFIPSMIASIDLNLVVYVAKIGGEIDSRVIVTRA